MSSQHHDREARKTLKSLHSTFISACHILHNQLILDAYGHLSVRHPLKPSLFIMSRYIAPGTVSHTNDLIEYHVATAEPVDPSAPKGYSERCIHSEIYKRYEGVKAVVHSHSEAVVPYSVSGVEMRACYHMAGFLGSRGVPVFDIAEHYQEGDARDMLVKNTRLGAMLAKCFSSPSVEASEGIRSREAGRNAGDEDTEKNEQVPDHVVVLMRGHGFTVVAESIEDVVLRAVYTQKNALIQTAALTTCLAANGPGGASSIRYLSEKEACAATEMTKWSAQRPWKLWRREVESCPLYVSSAKPEY